MILDALLQFSNNQNLALAAGSYDSTNIIDVGELSGIPGSDRGGGARDMGIGDPQIFVHASNTAAFTSGGAATLTIAVQGAPDNGAGAPGAFTTYAASVALPVANLGAPGRVFDLAVPRPPAGAPLPRFYKLVYTVGTAAFTAGTIAAYIVLDRPATPAYPAGINPPV